MPHLCASGFSHPMITHSSMSESVRRAMQSKRLAFWGIFRIDSGVTIRRQRCGLSATRDAGGGASARDRHPPLIKGGKGGFYQRLHTQVYPYHVFRFRVRQPPHGRWS
jgi:hypothetical protein